MEKKITAYRMPGTGFLAAPPSAPTSTSSWAGSYLEHLISTNKNVKITIDGSEYTYEGCGLPCKFVRHFVGASVITYHFNLLNPKLHKKVDDVIETLGFMLHDNRITRTSSAHAHFAVSFPREVTQTIYFRHMLEASWVKCNTQSNANSLPAVLGTDTDGSSLTVQVEKLPHMLIAGTTGSGKSVMINTLLSSLLFHCNPTQLQLSLHDPKLVELTAYEGIPHLRHPVATSVQDIITELFNLHEEMERRYRLLKHLGHRDWSAVAHYSDCPYILCVIDEFGNLMSSSQKVELPFGTKDARGNAKMEKVSTLFENLVERLAQKARAAGIHLFLATQQPSAEIITKGIRANFENRIALKGASAGDDFILTGYQSGSDAPKPHKLLGKGDAYLISGGKSVRFQGAYTTTEDVTAIVSYLKSDEYATYE